MFKPKPDIHTFEALQERLRKHSRNCAISASTFVGFNILLGIAIVSMLFDLVTDSRGLALAQSTGSAVAVMGIRTAAVLIIFFVMRTLHEMTRYHAYLADFYFSRAQGLSVLISKKESFQAKDVAEHSDAFMPPSYLFRLSSKTIKTANDSAEDAKH